MKRNKILVTGGAGLIGSQVIQDLNEQGIYDIIVCDHLGTSEKWKNLRRNQYLDYIEKDTLQKYINDPKDFSKTYPISFIWALVPPQRKRIQRI